MTPELQRRRAVVAVKAAAAVIALCVAVLTLDSIIAWSHTPGENARILELQEQLQSDSSLAPVLAEVHDAVTRERQARKARVDWLSLVLIAASATFIAGAKFVIALDAGDRPPVAESLVQIDATRAAPAPDSAPAPTVETTSGVIEEDLAPVDAIVARLGTTAEAAIPILQAIQEHYRYLPDAPLARVCEITKIRPAQIAGTSSFYSRFRKTPVGKHIVRVCHGTACHVSGARAVTDELRRQLHIPAGADTDQDRMFTVEEVACLGCCSLAPVLMVDEHTAGKLTPSAAINALDAVIEKEPA